METKTLKLALKGARRLLGCYGKSLRVKSAPTGNLESLRVIWFSPIGTAWGTHFFRNEYGIL